MTIWRVIYALLVPITLMAAGEPPVQTTPSLEGGMNMKPKILVVYFTRTGNTEAIAKEIAASLDADSEKIVEEGTDWGGFWGFFKAGKAAWQEMTTPIAPLSHHPKEYDLIIIGTPVWAWNMTPAVRSFLSVYRDDLKKVAFFATEGGSGHEKTFRKMESLSGKKPVATAFWNETDLRKEDLRQKKLSSFITAIRGSLDITSR